MSSQACREVREPEEILSAIRGTSVEERRRALRVGAELLDEALLVFWMRDEADDVLRNAAFEMLRLRGRRAVPAAVRLLEDADEDVVLQAVLILEHAGDPSVWPAVRPLLRSSNVNLVQAAIATAGRLGTSSAAQDLLPFLEAELWLQIAAVDALGQLRAKCAVRPVTRLLFDRDLSDTAADALTRIGGIAAARAVTRFWVACEEDLEPARWLPLLASCIATSDRPPVEEELRVRLARYVHHADARVAAAAAESLLALGPGPDDESALDRVLQGRTDAELPVCLSRRADLVERLLAMEPPACEWGWALVARDRRCVPSAALENAFVAHPPSDDAVLAKAGAVLSDVSPLVRLFAHGDARRRDAVARILVRRRREVRKALQKVPDVTEADRALLLEIAGAPAREVALALATLNGSDRADAVAEIRTRGVMARLPWRSWLRENEAVYAPLLGEVAARLEAREFAALVRRQVRRSPLVPLVACCGALRDRESAPVLIASLSSCDPPARSAIFRALAAIGGSLAHEVLQRTARGDNLDARLAARAIAEHATAGDAVLLRDLSLHGDWSVRLAAAEGLARCPDEESRRTLSALLADPVTAVAARARMSLDGEALS